MKKTLTMLGILLATPFVAFGYVGSDLKSIELRYNETQYAHEIVYRMNDGVGLTSNLTTSARTEERTYNRLWNVTKNTPAFEDYTLKDMETLFDWDAFNARREAVFSLVEVLVTMGVASNNIDTETLLKLVIIQETF